MGKENLFRRFAVGIGTVIGGSILIAGCSSVPGTSNAERQVPDQTISAAKLQEIQNDPNVPMAQKQAMLAAQQRQMGQKTTQKDAASAPSAPAKK